MYFRTRIFSISILTVCVVLAVIITLGWSRINKVELDHLDSRLWLEAKRILPQNQSNDSGFNESNVSSSVLTGEKLINDLVDKLRVDLPSQLMIYLKSDRENILTQSEGVDVANLIQQFDQTYTPPLISDSQNRRRSSACQLMFFQYNKTQWRGSFYNVSDAQGFIAVDVAATTSELQSTLKSALIVVIPFSLLLSILGAWFISTNTMRPINRLHKSMQMVTQKDLSHRLPEHKEDKEFKVLIDTYNTMLNRLEQSFQQTSRFTADAAHELKTPLTVLRGKLEQAVVCDDTSQLDLNTVLDEVGHLSAITRKLLLLSQADSGTMALHIETVDLTDLLQELIADLELWSDDLLIDQFKLRCVIEPELIINADSVLLRQLFNNLLVNMMRYSVHDKDVSITAHKTDAGIKVVVTNYCHSISDQVRSQLFERFYRGEATFTQGISGSGLGLSLAREIARSHGGKLVLADTDNDVFQLHLTLPYS